MSFFRTIPGITLLVLLFVVLLAVVTVTARVYTTTHPERSVTALEEFTTSLVKVEEVTFNATDGVRLAGWVLEGRTELPAIVLCHDLGGNKADMLNLAMSLRKEGFTVLCFDFRGHGESEGSGSGMGIAEKRDILGAVDYLTGELLKDRQNGSVGLYGVGTGAHAAVLAAADRPIVKVLVLDAVYPDASFALVRNVYGGWRFGARYLGFLPRAAYAVLSRNTVSGNRAAEIFPTLTGRDLLLVAPAGDTRLSNAVEEMYGSVPEQKDADANLITLPSTGTGSLYGDDLVLYHQKVTSFFATRLGVTEPPE